MGMDPTNGSHTAIQRMEVIDEFQVLSLLEHIHKSFEILLAPHIRLRAWT